MINPITAVLEAKMTAMPSHVRRHRDERAVVVGRVCSAIAMGTPFVK
jgi:hypothetical protein